MRRNLRCRIWLGDDFHLAGLLAGILTLGYGVQGHRRHRHCAAYPALTTEVSSN
jgi:hypothetical protein